MPHSTFHSTLTALLKELEETAGGELPDEATVTFKITGQSPMDGNEWVSWVAKREVTLSLKDARGLLEG